MKKNEATFKVGGHWEADYLVNAIGLFDAAAKACSIAKEAMPELPRQYIGMDIRIQEVQNTKPKK